MPDLNKIISDLKNKQAEIQYKEQQSQHDKAQQQVDAIDPRMGQDYINFMRQQAEKEHPAPQDPRTVQHDLSATSDVANGISPEERAVQQTTDERAGGQAFQVPQTPGGYSTSKEDQDFYGFSKENLITGTGGVIVFVLIFLCLRNVSEYFK